MSAQDFAEVVNVNRKKVWRMCQDGPAAGGVAAIMVRGQWRVLVSEVDRLIAEAARRTARARKAT